MLYIFLYLSFDHYAGERVERNIILHCIVLFLISFILFHDAALENSPLGLDALGHLSKVSYIKKFGFPSWDMSWYCGAAFLKFYPPLMYIFLSFFENPAFGMNLLSFLSIFLTSVGIYMAAYEISAKSLPPFFSGLLFLTVLNISYYYISVGNHPYVFAMWTLPFSLLFYERLKKEKNAVLLLNLTLLISILSHIFVALCAFSLLFLRSLLSNKFDARELSSKLFNFVIVVLPSILISGFWLVPFITHSLHLINGDAEYTPTLIQLMGFGERTTWGISAGSIGVPFFLFLYSAYIFLTTRKLRTSNLSYLFLSAIVFLFALFGGLINFYPKGIGAIRFILPLSIIMCIFSPLLLEAQRFYYEKKKFIFLLSLIVSGLLWNYNTIYVNYTFFSHNGDDSHYNFMKEIIKNPDFPIDDVYENERFGVGNYYFAAGFNYFFPSYQQTSGYYDQGILYPDVHWPMLESIRGFTTINETLFFLDWYGVRYFSVMLNDEFDIASKFENDSRFRVVMKNTTSNHPFVIYEYRDYNPIVSLIRGNVSSSKAFSVESFMELARKNVNSRFLITIISDDDISINKNYSLLPFNYSRPSPDKIEINFSTIENGDAIIIREYYYPSWRAKEFPSGKMLKIYEAGPHFMVVFPDEGSSSVVLYHDMTIYDYVGFILSLIGILLLFYLLSSSHLKILRTFSH
jgi:hypothetical protein